MLSARALFEPGKLSFADLRSHIGYLTREGLDATRYEVWFWRKALQPFAVLGLVLLAVAFVVGPLRETGMGARLTVGIAIGLGVKYLLDMFAPMSVVFGIPPWLSMLLPSDDGLDCRRSACPARRALTNRFVVTGDAAQRVGAFRFGSRTMTLFENRSGQLFRSRSNHIQQNPRPSVAKLARPAAKRRSACAGVNRPSLTSRKRHANMPSVWPRRHQQNASSA